MKVLFAGGGTGGHINPALSIANYTKKQEKEFEAIFVGTQRGLEKKLVPAAGYELKFIDIEGFDRKHLLRNIKVLKKLNDARRSCVKLMKEFQPDCVICTGGYVSGPVAMAAKKCGIPALIHEQNVYPGLTVKGAEQYVEYVAVSFEETVNHMNTREKCVVTGNPIRTEILEADTASARRKMQVREKPFVLIFGGSLGADRINTTVLGMMKQLAEENKVQLLFGTGDRNYEKIMQNLKEEGISLDGAAVKIVPYIDNMHEAMAAADLVVCRSGAITVSELAALGKPSILIPSPNVVRNHQEQNAREFEAKGAAAVITEAELTSEVLYNKIINMIQDPAALCEMSKNLKPLAKVDALEKIYELMKKMASHNL